MGLWHGANWTFVMWGLYHALLIAVTNDCYAASKLPTWIRTYVGWAITLPLVMLEWIPFVRRLWMIRLHVWKVDFA